MVQVKEAAYVPNASGPGEVQAVLTVGTQEIRSTLPIGSGDAFLQSLLDDLEVRIEKVAYLPGPGPREIQVIMTFAGRSYVSRIPVDEGDDAVASSVDRLLNAVGARFVRTMESTLRGEGSVEGGVQPMESAAAEQG